MNRTGKRKSESRVLGTVTNAEGGSVRIGIDMLGVQSPGSRGRGIGRLAGSLVRHLLALDASSRFVLYTIEDLPTDEFPRAANAGVVRIGRDVAGGETNLTHLMDRLAGANPDRLDVLFTLSPFELHEAYLPPAKPLNGLKLAAYVHDLIPILSQEQYLAREGCARLFYRKVERLKHYDLLLANSDATRGDFLRLLGLPPDRVVTVHTGCDAEFFVPDRSEPMPAASRAILDGLGVTMPFAFCLGGIDRSADRKNWEGLVEAFSLLPPEVIATHQLVLTCSLTDRDRAMVHERAFAQGVGNRFITTGSVPDETIRVLYQRCKAFCFPSHYEGFGLPLLEALHCGAAVIAGNNSAQIEVVGDAGLLANSGDSADIAAHLARVLTDDDLAATLRDRAPIQAAGFSWPKTAAATRDALHRLPTGRVRADRGHAGRPRLAVFAPLPPKNSGIADYSAKLIEHLKSRYAIDLYHDAGYVPEPALASRDFGAFDQRLFAIRARQLDYRGVLYQMGNSHFHRSIYETMAQHPGVVTLHDFCLSGFHWWYSHQPGIGREHFERELEHFDPARFAEYRAQFRDWEREPGGMQEACARRGLYLNRGLFERAGRVIVHSPWCVERARALDPGYAGKTTVVPMGGTVRDVSPAQRAAIRARFDLPADALILASFGILHMTKLNVEALDAFAEVARAIPSALFVFAGQDLMFGQARARAEALGLLDRVRFLGRQPAADFADLIAAADIGVSLRLPPTNGETSAALLDLVGSGVPTLVTDVGTFAEYPDSAVVKVRWDADGPARLAAAMLRLATDRRAREDLGRSAAAYVAEHHAWPIAAEGYTAVIEEFAAERRRSLTPRRPAGGRAIRRADAC